MDEVLFAAKNLELMLTAFFEFCLRKNIKLKGSKFVISQEVEFSGVRISSEELSRKDCVFIQPRDQRLRAFDQLSRPTTKKECQVWAGMVASLASWFPASSLSCPIIRKAMAGSTKLVWSEEMEREYLQTRKLMKENLKLSPYRAEQWLNMVIDGSSTRGIGYVLFQWLNEEDPSQGATIIQAGSSLLPPNLGFSPVDSELAGLQYACKACHYYLLHCPKLRLLSDNSGLIQMLQKDICSIRNPRHHRILT